MQKSSQWGLTLESIVDKERFLWEVADLEKQEASCWNSILWNVLSLLIFEPIGATVIVWYLWDQFRSAIEQRAIIQNLGSNIKWTAIGIAVTFTLTSLSIVYHLWRISSLKKKMSKVREEIARLEQN